MLLQTNIHAVELQKVSRIQAAGILALHASFADTNNVITWELTSYTIDENTGARADQDVISVVYKDSIRILLVKQANKYTFYNVVVNEGNSKDSIEVQVLNKGVPQKYLFQNPVYPTKPIPVYVILPTVYSTNSKMLFSMHGINRNAYDYANIWKSFGIANNYIIAAPEFSSADWSSSAYILGNMFTGTNGTGSLNPEWRWTFYFVQLIHQELVEACGIKDSTYILWGHSAGAQFVHRMALFFPDSLVSTYISANAGWYTAPDTSVVYPWGVKHDLLSISSDYLFGFTNRNLIVMRGTADTLRDSNLDVEPLSDAQGRNRFERAGYYYAQARKINPNLTWLLIDVPDVSHEDNKMAIAAGNYLLNPTHIASERNDELPEEFTLASFPNPFNATAQLAFNINQAGVIVMKIYNNLGEIISVLVNEYLTPGSYRQTFNAEYLPSGVYFCVLTDGITSAATKLLLLK